MNLSGNNINDLSELTGKTITLIRKSTGEKRVVDTPTLALEELIASNNNFATLNLENLTNLKVVDVSDNPNLTTLSVKNENNNAITSFNATNVPNLSCILVDNTSASILSTWQKDAAAKFVLDLDQCRSEVLSTEEFLEKDVFLYPNPVSNILTIESIKQINSIQIYNAVGKLLLKTSELKLDVSSLASGMYFLKITSENGMITKRIIKK